VKFFFIGILALVIQSMNVYATSDLQAVSKPTANQSLNMSTTSFPTTITLGQINTSSIQQQVFEFLTPIYKNLGIELKTIGLPSKRSLTLSNQGRLDGELLRMTGLEESYPDLISVPITLYQMRAYAYTIDGNKELKNASDILHFSVAIHRGVHWEESFANQLPRYVSRVGSTMQKFKLLTLGRVDYVLSSEQRAEEIIVKHFSTEKIVRVSPIIGQVNLIHYLHKKHEHIIPTLLKEINKQKYLLPLNHKN
jgi:polar amino acid transport system substrate-binding protein